MNPTPPSAVLREIVIDPTRDALLRLHRFRQLAWLSAAVALAGGVVGVGFGFSTGQARVWAAALAMALTFAVAMYAARAAASRDVDRATRLVVTAVLALGGVLSLTVLHEFPASTTVALIVGVAFAIAFLGRAEARRWMLIAAAATVLYSVAREAGLPDDVSPGLRVARIILGALSGELILVILWLATLSRIDLLERLQRREQAIAESPVGVVILDASATGWPIVLVNPAFARITGYGPTEALGRGLGLLTGPRTEPDLIASIERALGEGRPLELTIRHQRRDGATFLDHLALAPIHDSAARVSGFVGIVDDVTATVAAEERLRKVGRMDAVGLLAAGLAHDLNNVMMAISWGAELAKADLDAASVLPGAPMLDLEASLASISAAADRAVAMTASLLAIGRRQELLPRPVDLNGVINHYESVLRRLIESGQTLEILLAPVLPPVLADPVRLEQIVLNLVANAREAIGGQGHISIETAVEPAAADDGQVIRLSVSDDGDGVAPEIVEHIFEPFFTTKDTGTGLGLATVYGIVAQSGGTIDCVTGPGTGTTFHVRFPALSSIGH